MAARTLPATALLALLPVLGHAQGFLGGGAGDLDPKFCQTRALRETVIYVDDMVMRDDQTDWAVKLFSKLKATLVPSEKVSVVELSPANGTSVEKWSGCWPNFTAEGREAVAKQKSFFSADPLKGLDQQQKFFGLNFSRAINTIYSANKTKSKAVDLADPPKKEIVAALAADESRYSHSRGTVRAIIYSDMAENSDIASVYKPLPNPIPNIGKKLGTTLAGSVFYAFGVGRASALPEAVNEETRTFWSEAFTTMNAALAGIGSDLNISNVVPVAAHSYLINFMVDDQQISGRLSLLTDADGTLVDSFLAANRMSTAELGGTMRCEGDHDTTLCALNATTGRGIVSYSRSETLTLHGDAGGTLTGQFGVKGSKFDYPFTAKAASIN